MSTIHTLCLAQLTPPGLGKVNASEWVAVGLKQPLNDGESVISTTYVGVGRISGPDNYNPFDRASIYVINEEISHRFRKHWQYSGALSYRWQNIYPTEPDVSEEPSGRQEVRVYGRYSYATSFHRVGFSATYRPELRLFYNPDFSAYHDRVQFRSRLSGTVTFNLNSSETRRIITRAELLFSTTKQQHWSAWGYKESRFYVFYSIALPGQKVVVDIGYMNDLLEFPATKDAHYLSFDIIFKDLLRK